MQLTSTAEFQTSFNDDAGLRRKNWLVVEDYMSRKGETRLTKYLLFTEDGSGGLYTDDTQEPVIACGHKGLKAHGEWSLKCFPDWEWKNIEIYETQDPNRFWVECDGEGKIIFPGYPEGYYRNHFIHSFLMDNGKIKQHREFRNPCNLMHALGIPVPKIKRDGIPR